MGPASHLAAAALLALGCAGPVERHAPVPIARSAPAPSAPDLPGPAPWTARPDAAGRDAFTFAVVGDRTGGHRAGVFEAAIGTLRVLQPAFVASVGDLIEGYTDDPAELDAQWRALEDDVARLGVPFVYAPGNHDYANEAMARAWHARRGPSFHHFVHRDAVFLVLNSELFPGIAAPDGIPGPDAQTDQLAFARGVLDAHRDARWTFVFLHRPLWDRRRVHPDWLAIEAWLGDRPYTVFAGHRHAYTAQVRRGRRYLTLGTTGGASRLRGAAYGELDHVVLVHVGDGEPEIASLALDGVRGPDLRTADTRERVRALERAIRAEPLRGDGWTFARGTARFAVRNHGPDPLVLEGALAPGRDLVPGVERVSAEIAPGARAVLEVPVAAREPGPGGAMAPVPIDWTLRTRDADGAPLAISQTSWLLPETHFSCIEAVRPPRVDGRLDDWDGLPFAIEERPAPADAPRGASLRFGVVWDDAFVYLAARVVDPTPAFDPSRTARAQDAVHVALDARPAPARDANAGVFAAQAEGWLDALAFAWLLPGAAREDPEGLGVLPPLPHGTQQAARATATGYEVELAIPVAFLDARQGGPWSAFRLEVALQDVDGAGARVTHWWRPSRFGLSDATPVPGSGTFRRVWWERR